MTNFNFSHTLSALGLGLLFTASAEATGIRPDADLGPAVRPDGKGGAVELTPEEMAANALNAELAEAVPQYGIQYHGGPIMLGTPKIYYIWYGNWSNNTAKTILTDFAKNIAPSPYYNTNTTYTDATGTPLSNAAKYAGSYSTSAYKGKSLSDAAITNIVADTLTKGHLPTDENAVYFVLTAKDVTATSGFCTNYCGWHWYANMSGANIKFSFVGNPDRCPNACEQQPTASPNGNPAADAMASTIAHELEEAATDPNLNAWYDAKGWENADKCAWTFGKTYTLANGSQANMKLGARHYLIQQNWVNALSARGKKGYCALKY